MLKEKPSHFSFFFLPVVQERGSMYPHIKSTGVWDVVVNVAVVSQTDDTEPDQGTHIQGEDWDEQRFHAFEITVQENGHKHNLRDKIVTINTGGEGEGKKKKKKETQKPISNVKRFSALK